MRKELASEQMVTTIMVNGRSLAKKESVMKREGNTKYYEKINSFETFCVV